MDLTIVKNDNVQNHYRYNNTYYKEFIDFIDKIKKAFSLFSDSLNEILNKNYIFFEDNHSLFYSLLQNIKNHIQIESIEYKNLSNYLINEIIECHKTMKINNDKIEVNLNSKFNEAAKKFKKAKSKFDEYQSLFFKKMKETEKLIQQEKSITSIQEIKEKNLLVSEAVQASRKIEDKYKTYLNEVNDLVEEINSLEKQLAEFYKDSEEKILTKIQQNIYYLLATIKTTNFKINYDIEEINKKCLDIKYENEIKSLAEANKYILSNLKKLEFQPYIPSLSLKDSIKSSSKLEEMNTNYEVISYLQDYFTGICPDLDMEEEKRRKKLRTLCSRIFNKNQKYTKEDQNELIKFMQKEDYRLYFISVLTKQRINGKYQKEEKLFYEMLELINVILELAEKEKNYDNARNCIILSQTFYLEKNVDGKIKKIYIMEYIKKNKWLSTTLFWKEFIEDDIIRDKLKFEEESKLKDNGKNMSDVTKIYFGKLITYSHNMYMFGLTKQEANDIINYFMEKYKISDDMKGIVISNLDEAYDKNIIEKEEEIIEKIENINNIKNESEIIENNNENGMNENDVENGKIENNGKEKIENNENKIIENNNNQIKNEIENGNNIITNGGNKEIKNEANNNSNNNIDNNIKIEEKKENIKDDKDNKRKENEKKIIEDGWVIEGDGYGF